MCPPHTMPKRPTAMAVRERRPTKMSKKETEPRPWFFEPPYRQHIPILPPNPGPIPQKAPAKRPLRVPS